MFLIDKVLTLLSFLFSLVELSINFKFSTSKKQEYYCFIQATKMFPALTGTLKDQTPHVSNTQAIK